MRDRDGWHKPVSQELSRLWSEVPAELSGVKPGLLCQVELALRLLERLSPLEPARGAYVLFGGYPFARARGIAVTPEHEAMLTAGRHLLWTLRRGRTWHQALETYAALPERLRAYGVPADDAPARRSEPTVASDRIAVYDTALAALPRWPARRCRSHPSAGPPSSTGDGPPRSCCRSACGPIRCRDTPRKAGVRGAVSRSL